MSDEIRARITRRLEELNKSPRKASLDSGMSADAIRDMFRKPGSPTIETLTKLARGLETDPQWLAFGEEGSSDSDADADATTESSAHLTPLRQAFNMARLEGTVQAGVFLRQQLFDDGTAELVSAPRDPDFPDAPQSAYRVKGDSMDQARPTPIREDDVIVCARWEHLGLDPEDAEGLNVVVERTMAGGQVRELSVKELRVLPDRFELVPRSSNPGHDTIVVTRDFEADDGTEVRIKDLVRFVVPSQPLPGPKRRRT